MDNIKILNLEPLIDDKTLKSKTAHHFNNDNIKHLIDYDCDCYDENNNLIFKFRKNVIKNNDLALKCFHKVALQNSNARGASSGEIDKESYYFKNFLKSDESILLDNKFEYKKDGSKMRKCQYVYSTAIGNFDVMKRFGKEYPCRMTELSNKFFNELVEGIPYLEELSDWYKLLNEKKWEEQYEVAKNKDWNIGNTPFTTLTINRNFRTGLHQDKGDFGGWATLSVLEEGKYNGGYFMMPKYGVGIDIRQGDILCANVHQLHCNSEFYTNEEQDKYNDENCKIYKDINFNMNVKGSEYKYTRISFVSYCRKNINKCPNEPEMPIKNIISPKLQYEYSIAIPSYKRYDELKLKTLTFLNNHNIDKKRIHIFIRVDDEELPNYISLRDEGYNVEVLVGIKGIGKTHNYITNFFNENEFIIELDDDVIDIIDKDKSSILSFEDEMMKMKNDMIEKKISYGGLYPVDNKLFMSRYENNYNYDLNYILGICRLRFIIKDIKLETNYAEDFENCILHYIKDGKIIRNNWLCGKTKNYAKGGCNDDGRNNETEKKDKEYLANKYPQYCRLFQRKSGIWDLRIKHYKTNKK